MVLGKLPVPGRPTFWIIVGQGPIALAVGAGGGCLDIFTLLYPFSTLSPSLWETARYRLKYCLKGPLNPKHSLTQLWQPSCSTERNGLSNFGRGSPEEPSCQIISESRHWLRLVDWLFWV